MRKHILVMLVLLCSIQTNAQLVPCRPRIAMVCYEFHDDNATNPVMTNILTAKPDILIDNSVHGFWGEVNGGIGCKPSIYQPGGTKVFSYITGGYEGTKYGADTCGLSENLARIDGIAVDGADGVFLDEVSNTPDASRKAYLKAIHDRCVAKGLKLIFNPGTSIFDTSLMSLCDLLMSDEKYSGSRKPSASEVFFPDRMIVVAESIKTDTAAARICLGARENGFGYSYACDSYTKVPSWLHSYTGLIVKAPMTPTVSVSGTTLISSAPFGNQWYKAGTGPVAGATMQSFTPGSSGKYYVIVTLDGCSSAASDSVKIIPTFVAVTPKDEHTFQMIPNPAKDYLVIDVGNLQKSFRVKIYNLIGILVKDILLAPDDNTLNISDLPGGIYMVQVGSEEKTVTKKLVIK